MGHQRKNAPSNTRIGNDFEELTLDYFKQSIPDITRPFWLPIGHIEQKEHKFDLGSTEQKVIIECKFHTWTETGNVPSAKLTTILNQMEINGSPPPEFETDEDRSFS